MLPKTPQSAEPRFLWELAPILWGGDCGAAARLSSSNPSAPSTGACSIGKSVEINPVNKFGGIPSKNHGVREMERMMNALDGTNSDYD